jgi:hypothetical protein
MDGVRPDGVAVQVADALHGVHLAVQLNLVRLHHLLHRAADVADAHVDARSVDARVGGGLHSLHQRVVAGVEVDGHRTVDDPPVHVRPEIQLHHVACAQHRVVTAVGRVVRSHVVQRAAGGEGDASLMDGEIRCRFD